MTVHPLGSAEATVSFRLPVINERCAGSHQAEHTKQSTPPAGAQAGGVCCPTCSRAAKRGASWGVTRAMLVPSKPARPVRPLRCTYMSAEAGSWKCTTVATACTASWM